MITRHQSFQVASLNSLGLAAFQRCLGRPSFAELNNHLATTLLAKQLRPHGVCQIYNSEPDYPLLFTYFSLASYSSLQRRVKHTIALLGPLDGSTQQTDWLASVGLEFAGLKYTVKSAAIASGPGQS